MNTRSPLGQQWWGIAFSFPGCLLVVDPLTRHASATEMTLTILGVVAFVACFGIAIREWNRGASGWRPTLAIAVLGALFAPFNASAWMYFAAAACFSAWVVDGNVRRIAQITAALIVVACLEALVLRLPWTFPASVAAFSLPTVFVATLTLRRAIAVREMARHGERERIARDMHDVLGHTLSVIILKADLAARVAHQDPDRVVAELAEVDRIARETLEEVRHTLRGYRARSLEHEFELARSTLSIAGLNVTTEFEPPALSSPQENALCLALRECVTNIVRHARAKSCRLSVTGRHGTCQLEIEDDGQRRDEGTSPSEGQGLRGMRERVEASGGTVTQRTDSGTTLTIRMPLISDSRATA
jgi:two-component system sensor histidine kinase DesK